MCLREGVGVYWITELSPGCILCCLCLFVNTNLLHWHTHTCRLTCRLTQKETESGGECRGDVGIPKDLLQRLGQHNQCRNRKQRELCAVQRPCSFNVGVFEPEIKINNSKSVKQTNNKQAAAPAPAPPPAPTVTVTRAKSNKVKMRSTLGTSSFP